MANWDFVFPLNEEALAWLDEQGLAHPPLAAGNRLPSSGEIADAVKTVGAPLEELQVDLDLEDRDRVPDECFKMRGEITAELRVLRRLSESCGQFWMYPDTGEVAVIVDESTDPVVVGALWREATGRDNSWEFFHERRYAKSPPSE